MDDYRSTSLFERYQYFVPRFMTSGFCGVYLLMGGTFMTLIASKKSETIISICTLVFGIASLLLSYHWKSRYKILTSPNLH